MFGQSRTPHRIGSPRGDVLQRNIRWSMLFAELLAKDADLRERIPEGISIVLMTAGDEELLRHNHEVLGAQMSDEPVLVVRIAIHDSTVAFKSPGADRQLHNALA